MESRCLQIIEFKMGGKESKVQGMESLDQDNWNSLMEREGGEHRIGNSITLSNKMTGEQVDQFDIYFIDRQQYQTYLESCNFRNSHPQLIGIKYLNEQHLKELCSFTYHVKVYIQRIPLRLSNIIDIPYPENLYILKQALNGFKILYEKVGYFRLSQQMICMSEDGTVKVWLNPDLSKNYINYYEDYNSAESENQMIWDLLEYVDAVTDKQTEENSFINFIKKDLNQINLNFNKTLNFLNLFVEKWRIDIPHYFPSIIKKIRQNKGIYDSQIDNESSFKFFLQRSGTRGRFKQSNVVRIKTLRGGDSVNSFIGSESNRTYADKLNTFDSLMSNNYGFGKNDDRKKYGHQRSSSSIAPAYEDIKFIETHRSKNDKQSQLEAEYNDQIRELGLDIKRQSYLKKGQSSFIQQFPPDEEEESHSFTKGFHKVKEKDLDPNYLNHESRSSRCNSLKAPAVKFTSNGQLIRQIPLTNSSKSRNTSRQVSQMPSLRNSIYSKSSYQVQNGFTGEGEHIEQVLKDRENHGNEQEQEMDEIKTQKNYEIIVKSAKRVKQCQKMTQIKGEDKNYLSTFDFEYQLDPIIAADLAKYEEEQRVKKME